MTQAYDNPFWPEALRPIRDQLPKKSGTPRFLLVLDGKVVANHFGDSTWPKTLADLKKLLGKELS